MLHRNGVVAVEENFSGHKLHGRRRTWHRNGQLATEEFYFDGQLHGIVRQWNENGKLLGSFRMEHGTGTQKSWHDNGRLNQEFTTVEGEFCGRSRLWLRDGTLISDRVLLFGRSVTPGQYRKAAAKDPRLPKLQGKPAKMPARNRAMQKHILQVFVAALLKKENFSSPEKDALSALLEHMGALRVLLQQSLDCEALSYPLIASALLPLVPEGEGLFLGNSLTIRAFDAVSSALPGRIRIISNRGVSGVEGNIAIITGTLGKALGGASGGYTSGRREIIEYLRQRSRPYLFSNTLAPGIAGATILGDGKVSLIIDVSQLLELGLRNERLDLREMLQMRPRILPGLGGPVEIFLPAPAPPITGQAGFVGGMTFLLPFPPVIVGVIAFNLVGGSCCSPQKTFRKMKCGGWHEKDSCQKV